MPLRVIVDLFFTHVTEEKAGGGWREYVHEDYSSGPSKDMTGSRKARKGNDFSHDGRVENCEKCRLDGTTRDYRNVLNLSGWVVVVTMVLTAFAVLLILRA